LFYKKSATVSAGDVFEYQVSSDERMTPNTGATVESKAQIITADDEVIVYASNKQVKVIFHYSSWKPIEAEIYFYLNILGLCTLCKLSNLFIISVPKS